MTPQDSEAFLSSCQNAAIWCWSALSLSLCCHHIYHHPPPGNKHAAPTPPPAGPPPPLSIWPLNSSALPLQIQRHTNVFRKALFRCASFTCRTKRDCPKKWPFLLPSLAFKKPLSGFSILNFSPIPSQWHADVAVKLGVGQNRWVRGPASPRFSPLSIQRL